MKPCRAIRKTVHVIPLKITAIPSASTDSVSAAAAIATASRHPTMVSARRSPIRATRAPAGREATRLPMPSRATTMAAVLTSAPSSRARRARIGITAPCPTALRIEGPYAGRAMSRKRKSPEAVTRPSSQRPARPPDTVPGPDGSWIGGSAGEADQPGM